MGGLCTDSLWRGYRFAMNNIKKSKNISGEAYIQSFDANARVLINLSIFWLVFIMAAIGDALCMAIGPVVTCFLYLLTCVSLFAFLAFSYRFVVLPMHFAGRILVFHIQF